MVRSRAMLTTLFHLVFNSIHNIDSVPLMLLCSWILNARSFCAFIFLTCPINFREKSFLMNFLWSYLFETGTDRAEILHSCQTRGTEQLLPWSKRGLPLKKSEIPWFAVVLSARARARAPGPPELGASSPYPERGPGIFQMARALLFFSLQM